MSRLYRAAVLGLGNIAWKFDKNIGTRENFLTHSYSYLHNEKTTLVGGCAPDRNDREAFEIAFGVPTFETFSELVDRLAPDIVSICSPSQFHYKQVSQCLDCGIPMIWLEKPPTGSLSDLERLIRKASRSGAKVLVNYQRRYMEIYRKLRTCYREAPFGECRLIQLTYSRGLELNGSHIIDMLFFVTGDRSSWEVDTVSSFGSQENPCFSLKIDGRLGVVISGIELPYHCIDISLICEKGRVSVLHGGMWPLIEQKAEHELFPGFFRLKEVRNWSFDFERKETGLEEALKDLIDSFEKDTQPVSNLVSAWNCQAVMESVRREQGSLCKRR